MLPELTSDYLSDLTAEFSGDDSIGDLLEHAREQIIADHNLTAEQTKELDSRLDVQLVLHTLKG